MKVLRSTIFLRTFLFSLLLVTLTGCENFRRHEPSQVGLWYPNYPFKNVELTKDDFWHSNATLNFGGRPVIISAVGDMTYNRLIGHYYETAILEIHFKDKSVGYYYARISWLKANGRIEYTRFKSSGDYFWEGFARFLLSPLGIIFILIVLVFSFIIVRKHFVEKERNRLLIETLSPEEKEKKRQEDLVKRDEIITTIMNRVFITICIGVIIWLIYINWDAIIEFFLTILLYMFGIGIIITLISRKG